MNTTATSKASELLRLHIGELIVELKNRNRLSVTIPSSELRFMLDDLLIYSQRTLRDVPNEIVLLWEQTVRLEDASRGTVRTSEQALDSVIRSLVVASHRV